MNRSSLKSPEADNYQRTLFLFNSMDHCLLSLKSFLEFLVKSGYSNVKGGICLDKANLTEKSFSEVEAVLTKLQNVIEIKSDHANSILGLTLDFLVLDLRSNFSPNMIIGLIGTIRAGGIIALIGSDNSVWLNSVNRRYFPDGSKSYLLEWFLAEIKTTNNCFFASNKEIEFKQYFTKRDYTENLSTSVYNIPVTPDQKEVIQKLSADFSKGKTENKINIVIADRGRGKSAAVGIALIHFFDKTPNKNVNVVITSQSHRNIDTFFHLILSFLAKKGIDFDLIKKKDSIQGIYFSGKKKIVYKSPTLITRDIKSDILIIDEAASFPQDKLKEILNLKTKRVFISTIHGYEGTGKSFQYKIVSQIKRRSRFKFEIHRLVTPIRYSYNDSIEKLLNRTFLMDVERPNLDFENIDLNSIQIEFDTYPNPRDFFNKTNITKMRQIAGILNYAHYRNQPNDLLLIADSNRHLLATLTYAPQNNDKQLLLAIQLAAEGNISHEGINSVLGGEFVYGDLIPTIALRQFSVDFAHLRGLRIVRIAAHPDYINRGLGRIAINYILEEFKNNDWIGVSFGASLKLIKFWRKFGFFIVQIRPNRSKETGEWNVVLIKPLSDNAKKIIFQASRDFSFQFIQLLNQSLFDMRPELVIEILRSCAFTVKYKPVITKSGKYRLERYIQGHLNFLLTVDVLHELSVFYFVNPKQLELSSAQEMLLVSRILQGRTWGQALGKTGLSREKSYGLLRKGIKKIFRAINE
ncbi:MAG: GNAT family N-acetyltransferase [Candidatus Hodarchaeales archaeon]